MKVYGKENVVDIVSSMINKNRLAHSFLLYGEKGTGKKFMADYISKMIMCRNSVNGIPCGKCHVCRNIDKGIYSDAVRVAHSGKLEGFSVKTVREICSDANVFPNEGDKKVYIFSDCDSISSAVQNKLLKIIEEPPEFVYFIFTAPSKEIFLDTIISRVVSMGVHGCSRQECSDALEEHGFPHDESQEAVDMLGGNIGKCILYMKDEKFRKTVELTKKLADCIINRDEYQFLTIISSPEIDRAVLKDIIYMLDNIIRDSAVIRFDRKLSSGCYFQGASELSERLSLSKAESIHSQLMQSLECLDSNVNLKIITASLCRSIM